MNALPSIEIYVNDKSYAAPDLSGDRSVYIALFSEKGPDNTIEKMQNASMILNRYGKPNARKYGLGLYYAIKASLYTSNVYITRLLPEDATFANVRLSILNEKNENENLTLYNDANDENIIFVKYDKEDFPIKVNDKIYFENNFEKIYNVVEIEKQMQDNQENNKENNQEDTNQENNQNQNENILYKITLDKTVTALKGTKINKLANAVIDSVDNAKDTSYLKGDEKFVNSIFTFYPIGRGKFYNKYQIEFVRNEALEYLYVDEEGSPIYPYMFYDVYVFEVQEDGSRKLVEDPITVSLAPQSSDGTVFRHPVSGKELFIGTRINEDSENIKILVNEENVLNLFVGDSPNDINAIANRFAFYTYFTGKSLSFENGSDGSLYTSSGDIDWDKASTLLISAYTGKLNDELAKITDTTYQYYPIDYVPDPGYPAPVKAAIRELCDLRQDCLGLISTSNNSKYTQDLKARNEEVPYNTYNVMIYTQWRKIFDPYTGKYIYVPPTYHTLENHLDVDNRLGIAEPVAMFKAVVQEPVTLSYTPLRDQANELASKQLNPTIQEPDGTYVPTQYTAYKRLSILQRAHVVKVIHKFRKDIPKLLKDLLQRKATKEIINEAKRRVNKYLSEWLEGGKDFTKEALKSFNVNVQFDEINSTLYIMLDLKFIRAIEHIKIFMNVK